MSDTDTDKDKDTDNTAAPPPAESASVASTATSTTKKRKKKGSSSIGYKRKQAFQVTTNRGRTIVLEDGTFVSPQPKKKKARTKIPAASDPNFGTPNIDLRSSTRRKNVLPGDGKDLFGARPPDTVSPLASLRKNAIYETNNPKHAAELLAAFIKDIFHGRKVLCVKLVEHLSILVKQMPNAPEIPKSIRKRKTQDAHSIYCQRKCLSCFH